MRKRITLLIAALMMALTMSVSGVAFGAITKENPGGNEPGARQKVYRLRTLQTSVRPDKTRICHQVARRSVRGSS
jgi:hypothetical protein